MSQARPPYGGVPGWGGPTDPPTREALVVADWGQRFLARLIDVMIAQAVAVCVLVPALFVIVPVAGPRHGHVVPFLILALFFLVYWGYEVLCHRRFGATIGKRMLDLRVVRVGAGPADPPPEATIMLRAAVWAAPLLVSWGLVVNMLSGVFWLLNILWPLWDQPNRQALHDKAARTMVVRQSHTPPPHP